MADSLSVRVTLTRAGVPVAEGEMEPAGPGSFWGLLRPLPAYASVSAHAWATYREADALPSGPVLASDGWEGDTGRHTRRAPLALLDARCADLPASGIAVQWRWSEPHPDLVDLCCVLDDAGAPLGAAVPRPRIDARGGGSPNPVRTDSDDAAG